MVTFLKISRAPEVRKVNYKDVNDQPVVFVKVAENKICTMPKVGKTF